MTKVEKVKKLMEKYGLSIEDLQDVDDEETDTEPKAEEVKTNEVEGTQETEKEVETKAEEEKVEGTTEEVKAVEETHTNDIYKTQFEELNKKYDELKSLVEAQAMKTDKAYEILDAQGKKPSEEEYPYEQKLGTSDIRPNLNNSSADDMQFANALSHKKIR